MAMIRATSKKICQSTLTKFFKRAYAGKPFESFSEWHRADMNETDQKTFKDFTYDLYNRRAFLGPDAPEPRSKIFLWNYDAELFAFGKRFGEEFQMATLRRAFRHSSYEPESGTEETENASSSNEDLISSGENIIKNYVLAYLRYHFPKLPEEGIRAISAHLCSQSQLSYLANNLGMKDLVLAKKFPYDEETMADTFKAVVGALQLDSGEQRAEYFVQDFVLTELIDLDVNEIFYVKNPMRILVSSLEKLGKGIPESRILRQTGTFSLTPTYLIGIYVDGQLFGQAPGESSQIAEEMAARDCLKMLWDTHMDRRGPLTFGQKAGRKLKLDSYKTQENESLRAVIDFDDEADLIENAIETEPFDVGELYLKYKEEIEPTLGKPHRRRLKNLYYHGSVYKKNPRPFIAPNVKTI